MAPFSSDSAGAVFALMTYACTKQALADFRGKLWQIQDDGNHDVVHSMDSTVVTCDAFVMQEVRLHEAMDQRSEGLALLLNQFSTLKFILGDLATARTLSQRSTAIAQAVFKAGGDQVKLIHCLR